MGEYWTFFGLPLWPLVAFNWKSNTKNAIPKFQLFTPSFTKRKMLNWETNCESCNSPPKKLIFCEWHPCWALYLGGRAHVHQTCKKNAFLAIKNKIICKICAKFAFCISPPAEPRGTKGICPLRDCCNRLVAVKVDYFWKGFWSMGRTERGKFKDVGFGDKKCPRTEKKWFEWVWVVWGHTKLQTFDASQKRHWVEKKTTLILPHRKMLKSK